MKINFLKLSIITILYGSISLAFADTTTTPLVKPNEMPDTAGYLLRLRFP